MKIKHIILYLFILLLCSCSSQKDVPLKSLEEIEAEIDCSKKCGKWIANVPRRLSDIDFANDFEKESTIEWRSQYTTGLPKATDRYSVDELAAMGVMGLYERIKK